MKILKIDYLENNYNNINFKSKPILTNKKIKPKMDLFCKSQEIKEGLMKKFIKLRDSFAEKYYPAFVEYCVSEWDFYINSTKKNMKINKEKSEIFYKLLQDEVLYKKFLKIEKIDLDKREKLQLKNIINILKEQVVSGEELEKLREIENKIAQKKNSFVFKIDNKEISKTEISKILEKEKNIELRKKAYTANIESADLIAEDLKGFVIKRNEYAKKIGYSNYYEYKLKEDYEVELEYLENLLNEVFNNSKDLIKKYSKQEQEELAKTFGINIKDLKAYHYGLLIDKNPQSKINEYIKNKELIPEISKKTYLGMGFDIENFEKEGKLVLDLYPRKGKNTHGFCFPNDAGLDVRILANLTNNYTSLETLLHELGHAVYNLNISRDLTVFERNTYPAMDEAIAMMMQDLALKENILEDIIPKNLLKEFKQTYIKEELNFIKKALLLINFEKEMYKNPKQDLKKLWHDLKIKYQMRNKSEDLDNGWALIPHYISHPAYYQNYFRATIIKVQIYNYLKEKLGNITENKETSKVLTKNLFTYGLSMKENELIENLTGKILSTDDFIKSIKD